jgi:hypothetical protein
MMASLEEPSSKPGEEVRAGNDDDDNACVVDKNPLPLGVNFSEREFEKWLQYDSGKKQRKRKDIERAIMLMESRERKNLRELSDTQESLEKFKGKKPEIVFKFLRELISLNKSKSKDEKNRKGQVEGDKEEQATKDWFNENMVNVSDERMMSKIVNENVMAFQNVRRKVERETFAEEKRAWMEEKRKEREKERTAKREQDRIEQRHQKQQQEVEIEKQKKKKGKLSKGQYAIRLEAAIAGIDCSFWKVKTKEDENIDKHQRPKAGANIHKQMTEKMAKAKNAMEREEMRDEKQQLVRERCSWEAEEVPEDVKELREYIKGLGGHGNSIRAKDWVIKKWTRKYSTKSGEKKSYKTYHHSNGAQYRSRREVAEALGL